MDKNSIFGILLIAAILIIWGVVQSPDKKELEARKRSADSLALIRQAQAVPDTISKTMPVVADIQAAAVNDSATAQRLVNALGVFAANATGDNKFYTIENDLIKLIVSSKGGRPYSVELKKYKTFNREPVVLFNGDSTQFGLTFYDQNKPISTNELYFKPADTLNHNAEIKRDSLIMRLAVAENKFIEYRYSIEPGSYMVGFTMQLVGMNDIVTRDPSSLDMSWEIDVPQQEQVKKSENGYTSLYYRHYKDDVDFLDHKQVRIFNKRIFPHRWNGLPLKTNSFHRCSLQKVPFQVPCSNQLRCPRPVNT